MSMLKSSSDVILLRSLMNNLSVSPGHQGFRSGVAPVVCIRRLVSWEPPTKHRYDMISVLLICPSAFTHKYAFHSLDARSSPG